MRIPKANTVRSRIHHYAYKMGMVIIRNSDESYNLWSIPMAYTTHRGINMDTVVRVIMDEMNTRKFRLEMQASLDVGA